MKKILIMSMIITNAALLNARENQVEKNLEKETVYLKANNDLLKGVFKDRVFLTEYKQKIEAENEKEICTQKECIEKSETIIIELDPTTMQEEGLKIKMD